MTHTILAKEKVMLVSKSVRHSAVIAVLAIGVAACSEGPTAPVGLSPQDSEALLAKGGNSGGKHGGPGRSDGSRTFTILPGVPVGEKFGDHVLSMPANAVCDPAKSPYGAGYWDTPCSPANQPIEVTAVWGTRGGVPVIRFSPNLRFVPAKNQSEWVNLSLKSAGGIDNQLTYAILWYDRDAHQWVDEAAADPTLKTRKSKGGNLVTRRLKHFSEYALYSGFGSYNVTSGFLEDVGDW